MNEPADIVDLTRGECLRLLGAGALGRVVFTVAAMPAVAPVRYVLDGDEVVFTVRRGGPLAAATHRTVVGFQADEIAPGADSGWSVLGIGLAYEVTDLMRLAGLAVRHPGWSPDTAARVVAVPLQQLTGHRITPSAPDSDGSTTNGDGALRYVNRSTQPIDLVAGCAEGLPSNP